MNDITNDWIDIETNDNIWKKFCKASQKTFNFL